MREASGARVIVKVHSDKTTVPEQLSSLDDDISCANTGTCVLCLVDAITPWQDPVSPIINYRGEVHCYQPDQGWVPGLVGAIIIQVGLWDTLNGGFVKLTYPPFGLSFVSQIGLTDAVPITRCGVYETAVFVTVYFLECCPINAMGGFGSAPRRIGC
jgi:hypothetical protein